jgi:inhibitor of KinA
MTIAPASDSSLLVVFGNAISPELNARVIALCHGLQALHDNRIRNLHPGYTSLLVDFDPLTLNHAELQATIEQLRPTAGAVIGSATNIVIVPVCYGGDFGPDLSEVAAHAKIAPEDVIRLHSSPIYDVCFLGFSPGFAYLGGLPELLHTPRLATPRQSVAAGTVGIAGGQTGIYPVDSPGGWRLIGRTPMQMFCPGAASPTRLQPGGQVRFSAIDRTTFDKMSGQD